MIKLKKGDLLAFQPSSKMGEMIRVIDSKGEGKYSHWAIFWGYKDGAPLFLESVEGVGVRPCVLLEWRQNYDVYRPVDPKIEMRDVGDLILLIGAKYDYKRIWVILKNRLFGTPLYADSPTKPICTEFVNFAYRYKLVKSGQATPFTLEKSKKLECVYKSNE